ncbi:MAG: AAA family ATPase [Lachnospiraceae bacterium]|nr:AAA family ATPase [Lachnospiraceae bacterium]
MSDLKIPVGVSDFGKIRENGYYYIDKSGLIPELLKTESTEATLITRPRRFGKTLGMSMLAHFFDIREDSRALFEGLEVSKNQRICTEWMNQYPTLFVTFKDVDGLTFTSAYGRLQGQIADLCKKYVYLTESSAVDEDDKKIFFRLKAEEASEAQVSRSLSVLLRMMHAYYGKPAILLLDEYDVPVVKASSNGYYDKMLEVIKTIMSTALKDNDSLRFAVVTGCLRITKESIFTGTNNFTTNTISDNRYNEFFGFTHEEVKKFLRDADCEERLENVQAWYDGYHFGDLNVYCPWDVLNYVKKLITEGVGTPENFWEHTSDNGIIVSFLERTDFAVGEKFEILLKGDYIKEVVMENLTYDFLTATEENLWSLLYLTGYLTHVRTEELEAGDRLEGKQVALKIPNAEVMDIFRKSVVEWFNKKAVRSDRHELFHGIWNGEAEKLTELLSNLLFDTISFHDYAESFYHAFITGLLSGAGYVVESNHENGLGRPDIVIKDRSKRRAVVIEIKIADSEQHLKQRCKEALKQIEQKKYAKRIEGSGFKTVIRFGIAFYQKSCLVEKG